MPIRLVLLRFDLLQHLRQRLLENAAAEDPLKDRIIDLDISVLELEGLHDVLDACVSISGELLRNEDVCELGHGEVYVLVLSSTSRQREPLVDDIHLLWECGVPFLVDCERLWTSFAFQPTLACFTLAHLGLLQVPVPSAGLCRLMRGEVALADDFI